MSKHTIAKVTAASRTLISKGDKKLIQMLDEFEQKYMLIDTLKYISRVNIYSAADDLLWQQYKTVKSLPAWDNAEFVQRYIMKALEMYGESYNNRRNYDAVTKIGDLTGYIDPPRGKSTDMALVYINGCASRVIQPDDFFYYVSISDWVYRDDFAAGSHELHTNVIKSIYIDHRHGRLNSDIYKKLLQMPVRVHNPFLDNNTKYTDNGRRLIEINEYLAREDRLPTLLTKITNDGITYGYKILKFNIAQCRLMAKKMLIRCGEPADIEPFDVFSELEEYMRKKAFKISRDDRAVFIKIAESYIVNGLNHMLYDINIIALYGPLTAISLLEKKPLYTAHAHRNYITILQCLIANRKIPYNFALTYTRSASNKLFRSRYIPDVLPHVLSLYNKLLETFPEIAILKPKTSDATYEQICYTYLSAKP
jgi:hypothetical protein